MRRALRVLALAAVLAATAHPAVAAGARLVVDIDEPFLLQGRPCPAGTVSIRLVSRYNPTSSLHEVWIGDDCLGVFRARNVSRTASGEPDTIRLERDAAGSLVLLGYTLRVGGRAESYRFSASPSLRQRLARAGGGGPAPTRGA